MQTKMPNANFSIVFAKASPLHGLVTVQQNDQPSQLKNKQTAVFGKNNQPIQLKNKQTAVYGKNTDSFKHTRKRQTLIKRLSFVIGDNVMS